MADTAKTVHTMDAAAAARENAAVGYDEQAGIELFQLAAAVKFMARKINDSAGYTLITPEMAEVRTVRIPQAEPKTDKETGKSIPADPTWQWRAQSMMDPQTEKLVDELRLAAHQPVHFLRCIAQAFAARIGGGEPKTSNRVGINNYTFNRGTRSTDRAALEAECLLLFVSKSGDESKKDCEYRLKNEADLVAEYLECLEGLKLNSAPLFKYVSIPKKKASGRQKSLTARSESNNKATASVAAVKETAGKAVRAFGPEAELEFTLVSVATDKATGKRVEVVHTYSSQEAVLKIYADMVAQIAEQNRKATEADRKAENLKQQTADSNETAHEVAAAKAGETIKAESDRDSVTVGNHPQAAEINDTATRIANS